MTPWPAPFDDGQLRRRLGVETTLRRAPVGSSIGKRGADADVVVVLEGAFALGAEGGWVRGRQAPVTSGLDAWLAEEPWTLERYATEPTLYASVSRQALDWAVARDPALVAKFARHVASEALAAQVAAARR